jgi:hypothetical protein
MKQNWLEVSPGHWIDMNQVCEVRLDKIGSGSTAYCPNGHEIKLTEAEMGTLLRWLSNWQNWIGMDVPE